MAFFSKNKKTNQKENSSFEKNNDIKKMYFFVVIVPSGNAGSITKLMSDNGSSAQFVQRGNGTANKEVLDILGIEDNGKDIIFSIVKQESIENIKIELNAFFAASRKNKGIGFTIPLESMIGVKVYQFLADVL